MSKKAEFTFIDLFAGIGGFHQALTNLGGTCVFASEIDSHAKAVYELNFSTPVDGVSGDIIPLTDPFVSEQIPFHDVLCAGFPCQPFSKGGSQRGINEARGTLFFNIAKIIEARKPKVVLLENVRNLVGPKHMDTFLRIVEMLRDLGYTVDDKPLILSPHNVPLRLGGRPQSRERLYIFGVRNDLLDQEASKKEAFWLESKPEALDEESRWSLDNFPFEKARDGETGLSEDRQAAFNMWANFVKTVGAKKGDRRLPGFPIWEFALTRSPQIQKGDPQWKIDFLRKNSEFYLENKSAIDHWKKSHASLISTLPASYLKCEWQAGMLPLNSTLLQFRPSGLRFKVGSHFPALVAINQTSFVPRLGRYISVSEAAHLQGFPQDFNFGAQGSQSSFKQLGNAVCVGLVQYVLQKGLEHYGLSIKDIGKGVK